MPKDRTLARHIEALELARARAPAVWTLYEDALGVTIGPATGQCPETNRAAMEALLVCLGEMAHRGVEIAPEQVSVVSDMIRKLVNQ